MAAAVEPVIDLTNACLQALPPLSGRRTKVLRVSQNAIRLLWAEDFPRDLEELYAEGNRLIDDGLLVDWPQSLRIIDLTDNPIRYLEHTQWWPQNLRVLTLSYCDLRGTLAALPAGLEILRVDHTALEEIRTLPRGLRELHATSTRLERLPREFPAGLIRADLSRGRLTSKALPCRWPAALEHLDLHGNSLAQWPRGLPAGLKHLNLSGNRITEIGALPVGLRTLHLGKNYIREIPAALAAHHTRYTIQDNCLVAAPLGNCLAAEEQWNTPFHIAAARLIQAHWSVYRLKKGIRIWRRIAALKWEMIATAMQPARAGRYEDISPEWNFERPL